MKNTLIMTPGPTYIHEDVRQAMAQEITNPDLDKDFFEFYKATCDRMKTLLKTKNDVLILSGEGILGLEAACASLVEPDDKVLCIDNGIFGRGFGDFLSMYGGQVTYFEGNYKKALNYQALETFLRSNNDFKLATLVHCETPSGITNDIKEICLLLKSYGILTVVDAVSAAGGEPLQVDAWGIDILLGGSQKCLSAPPGLTFLSVSEPAWHKILRRQVPIQGYYCNLSHWKTWYEDQWFPYTQAISDIYGLRAAVDRLLEDGDFINRHQSMGQALRLTLRDCKIDLYAENGHSNTVTTIALPEGLDSDTIFRTMMADHKIMIAGAFGHLKGKVIRIGHMGENCYEEKIYITLKALDQTFRKHGYMPSQSLHKTFVNHLSQ